MRVLIVEDERGVGIVLRDFMLELSHDAELVQSAEAALRWLRQDRPDMVLLDFSLPGMSGLDFLELREVRESRIPVVVLSGVADERQAQACLQHGAVDFVVKPIPFKYLRRILETLDPRERTVKGERRHAPRARVGLLVTGRSAVGVAWETMSVDLSPHAIKVRSAGTVQPNARVTLSFTSPDGTERFEVPSLLVRVDLDGYVFHFANLTEGQLEGLTRLVRRLTAARRA